MLDALVVDLDNGVHLEVEAEVKVGHLVAVDADMDADVALAADLDVFDPAKVKL